MMTWTLAIVVCQMLNPTTDHCELFNALTFTDKAECIAYRDELRAHPTPGLSYVECRPLDN